MLWLALRLESVSILELPAERGERGADRPRSAVLFFEFFGRVPPTNPRASFVIIFCNSANFRDSASSSSAFLSASSSLIACSSSESLSPAEEDGDVGRKGAIDLFGACNVNVEDEVAFFGRGELFPSELRRARTPRGEPSLEFERPETPAIRPAAVSGLSPVGKSWCLGWAMIGLRAPWISFSPRISSWNLALTLYSKYGRGTCKCDAKPFPVHSLSNSLRFGYKQRVTYNLPLRYQLTATVR